MNSDNHNIYSNYKTWLVTEAANQSLEQDTGVEGSGQFTENLTAIDQLEDSFNKFFETGVRTKFLTQQAAAQAKQVVGLTISGFLEGLVRTSKVKDANQLEQMKKSITSKIKGIDTSRVVALIDQMKGSAQPAQQPQQPFEQPQPQQQPVQADQAQVSPEQPVG